MNAESQPLRLGIVTGLHSEANLWRNNDSQHGSAIIRCLGMGPERARQAAEEAVGEGARALMSFGIAGGLSREARVGQIVIPDQVVDNMGRAIACNPELSSRVRRLCPAGAHAPGALMSASVVIAGADDKQRLHQETGAIAVDMESFAVGEVAHTYGLPFAVVRTIADPADQAVPAALLVGLRPDGTVNIPALMRAVFKSPMLIQDIRAIARQSRIAHAMLRRLVPLLLRNL